jgi:membrane protease YdiL (CAAX protease family)
MTERRRVSLYLIVVFVISYLLQGVIWLRGGVHTATFEQLAPIVMFVPGVTALAFLSRTKGAWRSIKWGPGKPWYLVIAAVIPALMALLLVGLLSYLGLADSPHLQRAPRGVNVLRGLFILGKGTQTIPFFLLNLVASAMVLGVLNGLVTVGEEIGWRGFLQPRLVSRFRFVQAIAILGLIWAHWHTPVILMGYNYPETPVLGAFLLWPATCICWSFLAAWLTLNGESLWPAVVVHGSCNAFLGGLVDGMTYHGPRLRADLIVIAAWLVLAAVAFALTRKPRPNGLAAMPIPAAADGP